MLLDKIKEIYKDAKIVEDVHLGLHFSLEEYDLESIFEEDGVICIKHKIEPQAFKRLYDIEEAEYAEIIE